VYLEFCTINDNVNALTALTTPFIPSVTLNVKLKVPTWALLVEGVIVNTLSAWDTVAVLPNDPDDTA